MSEPTSLSRAKTRDGAEIAYRIIKGEGGGRIALTHSLAMDHQFWEPAAAHLTSAGDVLVWDCRGHGASTISPGPYTCEQFADDLADVLDHAGWDTTSVAGASMGGCITLAFVAAYGQRVRGLGLVDTTAWYGAKAPEQWEERAMKAKESGMATLVGFQKSRWFSAAWSEAHPDEVQGAVDVFLKNDIDAYVETCRMLGRFNKTEALAAITAPTRIAVGTEDYATPPAMAEAMHAAIKGSTLKLLEGAAHLTPMERPEDVAAELRQIMLPA
jgi:3-oxoadipate enol-lactonase